MNKNPSHRHLLRQKFAAIRAAINRHRLATMLVVGLIGIGAIGNIALVFTTVPLPPIISDIFAKPKPVLYYAPLTGLPVKDKAATTRPVTAIMIENSPDARPQSGLKDAEVVYEAIAEGGITRFMAVYQQNKPRLIGPVRSVRSYHPDWLKPYNASIAHVGGSAAALKVIRGGGYRDIDQFFNDGAYWRATDRYAPHNVYTSFSRLDALNKQKKYIRSSPKPFHRGDAKPAKPATVNRISVTISSALFNSTYRYNPSSNTYTRSQGGGTHVDREKGAITPRVIIILNVNEQTVMEETLRERIQTTGRGKATIFQNGTVIKATWKKAASGDQYSFVDSKDKPIELARGQTWITALPNGKGSVSWRK